MPLLLVRCGPANISSFLTSYILSNLWPSLHLHYLIICSSYSFSHFNPRKKIVFSPKSLFSSPLVGSWSMSYMYTFNRFKFSPVMDTFFAFNSVVNDQLPCISIKSFYIFSPWLESVTLLHSNGLTFLNLYSLSFVLNIVFLLSSIFRSCYHILFFLFGLNQFVLFSPAFETFERYFNLLFNLASNIWVFSLFNLWMEYSYL